MQFIFTHSHAFPKGSVIVESDKEVGSDGLAIFGDGVTVAAEWHREGEDIVLDIPYYQTAKGAAIRAHRWRLTRKVDGSWRSDRES